MRSAAGDVLAVLGYVGAAIGYLGAGILWALGELAGLLELQVPQREPPKLALVAPQVSATAEAVSQGSGVLGTVLLVVVAAAAVAAAAAVVAVSLRRLRRREDRDDAVVEERESVRSVTSATADGLGGMRRRLRDLVRGGRRPHTPAELVRRATSSSSAAWRAPAARGRRGRRCASTSRRAARRGSQSPPPSWPASTSSPGTRPCGRRGAGPPVRGARPVVHCRGAVPDSAEHQRAPADRQGRVQARASISGSVTVNVAPAPGAVSSRTVPQSASTMAATMARPVPSWRRRAFVGGIEARPRGTGRPPAAPSLGAASSMPARPRSSHGRCRGPRRLWQARHCRGCRSTGLQPVGDGSGGSVSLVPGVHAPQEAQMDWCPGCSLSIAPRGSRSRYSRPRSEAST